MSKIIEKLKVCRARKHGNSQANSVANIDDQIAQIDAQIKRVTPLYEQHTGMSQPNGNKLSNGIVKLIEAKEKLAVAKIDQVSLEAECRCALHGLPFQQRQVLEKYYIDGLESWQIVAEELGYSVIWCKQLHQKANNILKTY